MSETPTEPRPPAITLPTLFLKFLGFGALAFGGPVAQIAMLRDALVSREHWISSARFNRLLAVMQVLPGPEAHELCVHLGMIARGRWGGFLAGLGFMLPGFVLMLLAGWAYTAWVATLDGASAALLGIQIVVLAIILRAVIRIGQHVVEDRLLAAIALGGLVATIAGVPFWLPLLAAGIIYTVSARAWIAAGVAIVAVLIAIALAASGSQAIAATGPGSIVTLFALFVAGLKGGLLTFGGAYTAIPYVRADTVGRGWLSDATFLDGVALAGVLPAPLVIFATFVGYVAGGPEGALAITIGMFLPAFAFSLVLFERLEAIVEKAALHRALAGVAAAVVGIIAATFVQLGAAVAPRVERPLVAIVMVAIAMFCAWRLKGSWVTPTMVAASGILGWLLL